MDEKDFKKHLRDLAHGHHNPAEHDWGPTNVRKAGKAAPARRAHVVKPTSRKRSAK